MLLIMFLTTNLITGGTCGDGYSSEDVFEFNIKMPKENKAKSDNIPVTIFTFLFIKFKFLHKKIPPIWSRIMGPSKKKEYPAREK